MLAGCSFFDPIEGQLLMADFGQLLDCGKVMEISFR